MIRQSPDVDAEYNQTFHSTSFLHIWASAHQKPTTILLDPTQSSLLSAASSPALLDFIETTLQSFSACSLLLSAIHGTRSLLLSTNHLSSQIDIENPLSPKNLTPFYNAHSLYPPLLTRLIAERKILKRRARVFRTAKTAAAIVVILLTILTDATSAGEVWRRWRRDGGVEKMERRVDEAARGAYIVGRDMDTVSRMVRRAHDEVEHRREMVRILLRIGGEGEMGMKEEVVRELEEEEVGFEEQIEELEDHVCLCLVMINRSRRLVLGR